MRKDGDGIKERSYEFALRIIILVRSIPSSRDGNVLGRQVLRSGTSIGANVEATGAFSIGDFIFKMNTASKEARETHYWLRLIRDSAILPPRRMNSIVNETEDIKNILGAIVRSSRRK